MTVILDLHKIFINISSNKYKLFDLSKLNNHGTILWLTHEQNTITLGIVIPKTNTLQTIHRIREFLSEQGITEVEVMEPEGGTFDEGFVRRFYEVG